MQWILDNWLLILLVGGMGAMHLFGHGHGKGRKKGDTQNPEDSGAKSAKAPAPQDKKADDMASRSDPEM
jgi:hypothetical protein